MKRNPMKLLLIILSILFVNDGISKEHSWSFRESGTICSILTSNRIDLNANETVQYTVVFGYASRKHDLSEHLKSINLKPNEYVLQFNVALHHPAGEFGLLGDEIDVPIQLKVNDSLLRTHENEYGTTYYVIGEKAKQLLKKLSVNEKIILKVQVDNVEHLIPLTNESKDFNLKRRLLQTCETHFI